LDTGVFGYIGVINIRNIFLQYVTFRLKHPEYRQQLRQYRCGGNESDEEYIYISKCDPDGYQPQQKKTEESIQLMYCKPNTRAKVNISSVYPAPPAFHLQISKYAQMIFFSNKLLD
jgi:hypothetical protein